MNDESPARHDKFRAYRARKKAAGLRELRMWLPDVNAPGFQDELDREIAAINASSDETEVMRWIEAVSADLGPNKG